MTKKEQEIQNRLLDVIEANTKTLEALENLLVKWTNPLLPIKPDLDPTGLAIHDETPPEEPVAETCTDDEPEITPEYCRKALKAITKKTSTAGAKNFLATFGGAKTIPQLEKKYYENFIAGATQIMEGS